MMLNLLIRLVTEVILFQADRKLRSKTSITCWANAISSQQPYNLHKQWVLPKGNGLRAVNNEGFPQKREQGKRERRVMLGCSLVVIKSSLWGEGERKTKCAISTKQEVILEEICQFCPHYKCFKYDEHWVIVNCWHCCRYTLSKRAFPPLSKQNERGTSEFPNHIIREWEYFTEA